ncbi:MAG TPA: helix-turn-helix transcriptional regulator [Sphingobium sp.]|uniref:helix-turn-helix domain-containing protein n=1 Tax=Sphingobium sp. TaxID=1912891 RepID=UPI002ED06E00
MSTEISRIGARLLSVRTKLRFPQSKVAAILGVADRSYKLYEAGSRELPVAVALRFCEAFETDLLWLLTGEFALTKDLASALVAEVFEASQGEAIKRGIMLSPEQAGKLGRFIFTLCITNHSAPKNEVAQVFDLLQ